MILSNSSNITTWDFSVLNFIQKYIRCAPLDFFFKYFTHIGDKGIIWIIFTIIFICIKKYRKCGITTACGLATELIIGNGILKNIVQRDRPCWINKNIDMLIAIPKDYSFPSGHTFASFISATIIFSFNKKLGITAYIIAFLIAFSRLYLYVHFPTDVIAGCLLGIVFGIIIAYIANKIQIKQA